MSTIRRGAPSRALGEPFAFALVQWPACVGMLMLPDASAWRWPLGALLLVMQIAAYLRPRGRVFGHLMLLLQGAVAGACLAWPGPWVLAWLPVLLIGLRAAQRVNETRD